MREFHTLIEPLEHRRLLSTVNILSFGASVNDGSDDTGAIRAAINASSAGDTIYFAKGIYNIGSTIKLKGDRKYLGEEGATLVGKRDYHIFHTRENNIRIENFVFDGKPIAIDHAHKTMVEGISINDNVFHVHAGGSGNNGITFTTGLRNSSITNNIFDAIDGDCGIYGYYWDGLKIANNSFQNGTEGIHLTEFGNISKDLLVEQNYFSGIRRMGIELQGGGASTVVQDNYYEKPALSAKKSENDHTFAYSIIIDQSRDSIIRRNTAIAPDRPDGIGVRIVFEVGGDNTLVEQNYSVGSNHVLAANDGLGTTSVLARNNRWSGYLQGPNGRGLTVQNNGPDVKLDWNVNRGKPAPHKRLGMDGFIAKAAAKPQVAKPQAVSNITYLSDLAWKSARNGWGPVERNQNVGGKKANDGTTIKINGRSYKKGLGTAIDSEIVYNLAGQYDRFFSDIGIDDQAGNNGSVIFQVWADGKKIYDSNIVRGSDAQKKVSLDLRKVKQLRLITTNAGDGGNSDLANWGSARLRLASA